MTAGIPLLASARARSQSDAEIPLLASAQRERADVADLDRHLHKKTWADARILPPMPGDMGVKKSNSFNEAAARLEAPELVESRRLRQPGGFRRGHLDKQADNQGIPPAQRCKRLSVNLVQHLVDSKFDIFTLQWSALYEHQFGRTDSQSTVGECNKHKLGTLGVFFTLFKAGMGSGVLFQACAWKSGGYVLSTVVMPIVAATSVFCALRLIQVRESGIRGSYGDLMCKAVGWPGSLAINLAIVLFHLGCCCTYMSVAAQTFKDTILPNVPLSTLIMSSMIVLTPLALIRQVSKLRLFSIIGSVLILAGLLFILCFESWDLYWQGAAWDSVSAINVDGILVFAGMACFTFEGIGCVVPIYDSAEEPKKFPLIYICTQTFVCIINTSVALLGYFAFGEDTQSVILLNLPQSTAISTVKLGYAGAVVCTFPLLGIVAFRIIEDVLFGVPVSNPPFTRKCMKNIWRTLLVATLAIVTVAGSTALENFVSIIGALCGIPLAFVFPAIIHLVLSENLNLWEKCVDIFLIIAGSIMAVIITKKNLQSWGQS